jgi:hypothetical protein
MMMQDANIAGWVFIAVVAFGVIAVALWCLWRNRSVYRKELPRIYELHDLLPRPIPPDAYFQNLDKSLTEIPQKLRQFRELENDLQELDTAAWSFFKSELTPLLRARDAKRGWRPLFDKLNQAKAYSYLKHAEYTNIQFIPPSSVAGRETPDLQAELNHAAALCEVKTINVSDVEANRRFTGGVGTVEDQLNAGFFGKLASDVAKAKSQMSAHDPNPATKKIVYVIVNFDDSLHEYADRYQDQITRYVSEHPIPGIEVIFDIKPPFASAMS